MWRGGTILLLLWTIHWAYRRRPLTTAVIVALLAFPFGANLDTGNINLQLTLMLWAAQFSGPRLGGLLWALATWMKWIPVIVWPILSVGAKRWGLLWLAVSIGLSLRPPAVDHPPVRGAVRVRQPAHAARLPRVRVGVRAVVVSPADPFDVFRPATWLAGCEPSPESAGGDPRLSAGRRQTAGAGLTSTSTGSGGAGSSRRRSSTGRSRSAPMAKAMGPSRNAARGPNAGSSPRT